MFTPTPTRLILGDSVATTRHQLVALAQQYFAAVRAQYKVALRKVEAHVGIFGSELADSLAKTGVTSYGSLGRFHMAPAHVLLARLK